MKIICLIICILFVFNGLAIASKYPDNLWKGLIAEDIKGGYEGMYAVACCVRNRLNNGLSVGLVALKRKDLDAFVKREVDYGVHKYNTNYELVAKDIVNKVFEENGKDITKGATHYENVECFGVPYWARTMFRTIKIGHHTFYKEKE